MTTAVVSLVFAHRIIGIGIGTVMSALFIGRLIQVLGKVFGEKTAGIVEASRG